MDTATLQDRVRTVDVFARASPEHKLRRRQLLDADGRPLPAANAPLAGNPLRLVGDYGNPILKLEAAEIVRKQGELELAKNI